MKKAVCSLLALVIVLMCSGCDQSYEVTGLDRFNENVCSMGTCDRLMPSGADFISNHPYENGNFYYWTDGNYSKAKAFVWLQYPEDIYPDAKAACESYHPISSPKHQSMLQYEGFCFHVSNVWDDTLEKYTDVRMFGYNDDSCTLVFAGFSDLTTEKYNFVDEQNFAELMRDEFGENFKMQ